MRELTYHLLDVFTDSIFGGNQLAVVMDAEGLTTEIMQTIAREFNLSETVFLFPPTTPDEHYRLRIFTPGRELPMAGHPTVGTAFLLAHLGIVPSQGYHTLNLEENIGTIPVYLMGMGDKPLMVFMGQPVPEFGAIWQERSLIARMLGVNDEDLVPDLPVQVLSAGVPFMYVPLKTRAAVDQCRLRTDLWETHLQSLDANQLFVFCTQTKNPAHHVYSRMFAPSMGITEDPATGAASGPLGAYLVRYGLHDGVDIVSEQGYAMGRPSLIHITVTQDNTTMTGVRVGGQSVYVGRGTLYIPNS